MKKVLLTGFEPFGGQVLNASWCAAQRLHHTVIDNATVIAAQLSCSFHKTHGELKQLISRHQPDVVLCLGQASNSSVIQVEKVALNYIDARIADNDGVQPIEQPIINDGPNAYFASVPVKRLVTAVQAHQIPVSLSYSAGTFVCNQLFYLLMHELTLHPQMIGGFIHVPACEQQRQLHQHPFMSTAQVVTALKIMIQRLQQPQDEVTQSLGTLY
ncbi:pyroglutamyl-peptidase I [Shewanella sp. A32]|uniref:pyroglutamyl-peptidase I n=1 Tax=Shewanella sp. A32 TaxID=3031327 RepID=UPI0023B9E10C|nr:pyroglutamyl-peptidase I [Shewanella sp. A32]MDF0534124.1 pyroglutamyl-peptidase I [Shewanella sp. A32]